MIGVIVVAAVLLASAGYAWTTYNRMVAKRQATENSWSQIDVALRRRHDLIPTLVEAVKGYASHERTTFEQVTAARTEAIAAEGPARRAAAESALGRETGRLLVVAEAYPELEASTNFSQLQTQLRETEDQIAITRRVYNDTVETYNTLIQHVPGGARREALRLPPPRVLRRPGGRGGDARGLPLPRPRVIARRLTLGLLAAIAALLTITAPAFARSADITDADVALRLAPNGDLLVTERLTFEYDGHFEGSYRDIHLLHGESISDVSVTQDDQRFAPGGNTALGSDDRPGVFGSVDMGNAYRVVWHYRATDEQRATTLSYRVRDAVVAYDDVLDIGWAVWGAQWDFDLDHLTASFTNPALDPGDPLYRVWGHPRDVEGATARGEGEATLRRRTSTAARRSSCG